MEQVGNYLDNNKDIDVFYCALETMDSSGKKSDKEVDLNSYGQTEAELLKRMFTQGNCLVSPGMTMRREIFKKIFPLSLGMLQLQDMKMHVELMLLGKVFVSNEKLVCYRLPSSTSGVSHGASDVQMRADVELVEILNLYKSINDVEWFKNIFKGHYEEIGEPTAITIPYFLGRIALKSSDLNRRIWGYTTIKEFISINRNMDELHKLNGFAFKNFMQMIYFITIEKIKIKSMKRTVRFLKFCVVAESIFLLYLLFIR